jgi:integrase
MTMIGDTKLNTSARAKREERLSLDGKWRSFPKVPNLLQYVSTGVYFARVKVSGKLIRRSLGTDVFTTAKLKLGDFIKAEHEPKVDVGTFGTALRSHLRALLARHDISPGTKKYYRDCIRVILNSWPGFRRVKLTTMAMSRYAGDAFRSDSAFQEVQTWATELSEEIDEQYFNNVLGQFRSILDIGGIPREKNPAYKIKRLGIQNEVPTLPSQEQFTQLIEAIECTGAGQAQNCADLVRFLAFSGQRIGVVRQTTWADVHLNETEKSGYISFRKNKRQKGKNVIITNNVPIIPDMAALLLRLKAAKPTLQSTICAVGECEKSLTNACKKLGIARITHHDLRHLFATRCIESGVDIPTVSRWLGHSDGGALAMRVYGHLRTEHSATMAQKVVF